MWNCDEMVADGKQLAGDGKPGIWLEVLRTLAGMQQGSWKLEEEGKLG